MTEQTTPFARDVYIIDGSRTPFLKARNKAGPFAAADLGVQAGRPLLMRQPFEPRELDEVITGCVMPSPREANISRLIALRLGCGHQVPAWTVQRNCASGLQAIDCAAQNIAQGRSDLVLAGGVDAMSHAPLLFSRQMTDWFGAWMGAKTLTQRLALLTKIRPRFFAPVISLLLGLKDPLVNLSMGQTAENLAYEFNISRHAMDSFSVQSHERLAKAFDEGLLPEIEALYDTKGRVYLEDDGLRRECSVTRLAKLKPFFDKQFGKVTAGNSSQVTDGAAFLILASQDAVKKYQLPIMARVKDVQWSALDPAIMGLGPVHACTPILRRQKLKLTDVDFWEINEAFAAQVLACQAAWKSAEYCQNHLGLESAMGELDLNRLNVDGGAIAVGHPIGASGARLVLRLVHVLRREKARYGVASLCIGGGQGGAMLIENVNEDENA